MSIADDIKRDRDAETPPFLDAVMHYQQADMDGIMVLASRQAIHETHDAYLSQAARIAELEAVLENVKALAFELQALSEVELTAAHPQYADGHSDGLAIAFVKLRVVLTPKEAEE